MFILIHEKGIFTKEGMNICRKQHFWSVLCSWNPGIPGRICCWAGMVICWGHTPYSHTTTAPSAKTQAHREHRFCAVSWDSRHRWGKISLCSCVARAGLFVLDTPWPAQPGLLAWPKSTSGHVWMRCTSYKQQIHDLHLVDQWLVRELPTNFIVQSLHTLKVVSCLGDLPNGRF